MADFIGIGGQRCGTTWLYANLARHPEIRFPAGKEVHYWDTRRAEGRQPWLDMFPSGPDGVKQGEITPSYAILSRRVVREIHAAAPDARLVLSIRNPMQRAWSAAMLFLPRCQMDPSEATDEWFIDVIRSKRCRAKSTFTATIDTWGSVYSPEQLHLVVYDDIADHPVDVLRAVAVHLGVDPRFYKTKDNAVRDRQGRITQGKREPSAKVLRVLRDLHGQEIGRLEGVLGRDLGHWSSWAGQ